MGHNEIYCRGRLRYENERMHKAVCKLGSITIFREKNRKRKIAV